MQSSQLYAHNIQTLCKNNEHTNKTTKHNVVTTENNVIGTYNNKKKKEYLMRGER
jgi:hypothetical protein